MIPAASSPSTATTIHLSARRARFPPSSTTTHRLTPSVHALAQPHLTVPRPAGYLGARVEAKLVEDAADVARDRALGYEESRPDLLVGQALRDQPCDFHLPHPQNRIGIT